MKSYEEDSRNQIILSLKKKKKIKGTQQQHKGNLKHKGNFS